MGCTSSSSLDDKAPKGTSSAPNLTTTKSNKKTTTTTTDQTNNQNHLTTNSFVTRKGSELYLDDQLFRFTSLNSPELLDGDVNGAFEVQDTFKSLSLQGSFGRSVTRTYTLRIQSGRISRGHINGWNSEWGDWEWDEDRLLEMDLVLAKAAEFGVKLIIPIVNQDFGGEDTNWVGNTTDLIKYRKNITSIEEAKKIDFFTDLEMINAMKLIIDKLLNRINTFNDRRYGDDSCILAWETGNEMNFLGYRTAPSSWTITIAKHLKSLAPNTLVMDGSFARTENREACFSKEVLDCPEVDIFSYHYYGTGEISRVKKDIELVRKSKKVFIAGEYGFFDEVKDYSNFLSIIDSAGAAGSLIWSLRPHSSRGGFKTHSEGDGNYSYHIPGWSPSPHREFPSSESQIISLLRTSSYKILSLSIPPYPIPPTPSKPFYDTSKNKVMFQGVPWGYKYCLGVVGGDDIDDEKEIWDCTGEGEAGLVMQSGTGRRVRIRAISVEGKSSDWSESLTL